MCWPKIHPRIPPPGRNSYGPGVFVDQLCAAGLSAACGFGFVFNESHEASARKAIVENNVVTKPPFQDLQKHLFDGDTGITVCSYPHGRLGNGMMYENLVSTGFTSPVIAGLVLDGNLEDALEVATNIRRRHDGRNRTPWNEPECDVLYSRAMAHWNIFDQACGWVYDATKHALTFDPRFSPDKFNCFFICEGGWGTFSQGNGSAAGCRSGGSGSSGAFATLQNLYGQTTVASLKLNITATSATASIAGKPIAVSFKAGLLTFTPAAVVGLGQTLAVSLSGGQFETEHKRTTASRSGRHIPSAAAVPAAIPAGIPVPEISYGADAWLRRAHRHKEVDSGRSKTTTTAAAAATGGGTMYSPLQLWCAALLIFVLGALSASMWQQLLVSSRTE
eukprot:g5107.t1